MKPSLTIGMATYQDYNGVYFTVQALRLYHDLKDVEFVIVDNSPDSPGSQVLRDFLSWIKDIPCRYIAAPEVTGTAAPRNRVFTEARNEVVLCLDSHVLLTPGSIDTLRGYFADNPQSMDLVQGPMLYDDLRNYATHFQDEWRGEMWGTWGSGAYVCPCGKTAFDVSTAWQMRLRSLDGSRFYDSPLPCGCVVQSTHTHGSMVDTHALMSQLGCTLAAEPRVKDGEQVYGPAFEIPAMGLGAFACRKSAWLGFNPNFSGFGGEEWYIHEKFRKAGRKCWSLPGFRWLHRFGRPAGVPYPLQRKDKVRNYALGHKELGIPLDRLRHHFVSEVGFSAAEFDAIVAAVENKGCGCNQAKPQQVSQTPAHPAAPVVLPPPEDPAYATIEQYASNVDTAVYFTDTISILAHAVLRGCRQNFHLYATDHVHVGTGKKGAVDVKFGNTSAASTQAAVCQILLIDQTLTADALFQSLCAHAPLCSGRILLGGTLSRGEHYQDGPGILPTVRRFVGDHRQWTVLDHHKLGAGWLVLTCLESDKKPLPSLASQGWNFLKASLRLVSDGFGGCSQEVIESRLAECSLCPSRNNDRCGECGCYIEKKASWPKEFCPLGKWQATNE